MVWSDMDVRPDAVSRHRATRPSPRRPVQYHGAAPDESFPMSASPFRTVVVLAALVTLVASGPAPLLAAPAPTAPGSLHAGDRVVLLGDAFFEREGQRGFIETALVAAHPDAAVSVRNLGWSGDTVWADSRGVFDAPAKGYERMLALVGEVAPTVVFIAYGRHESEKGEAGLEAFRVQLVKLCADVRSAAAGTARSPTDVRLVLVAPHRFETADADRRNAALAGYAAVIREVAAAEKAGLVDLFALPAEARLTENGIHLSDAGYATVAAEFARACGRPLPPTSDFVPRSAELRRLVVAKNTLFFHRWRPANETYLFLFRKREQGNNAVEIPQFDPLVAEAEAKVQAAAREFR